MTRRARLMVGLSIAALTGTTPDLAGQAFRTITADMRDREYRDVRASLLSAARRMPAEFYGFRAASEIRSFGEELDHVAAVNTRLCRLALSDSATASQVRVDTTGASPAKAAVLDRLVRSF